MRDKRPEAIEEILEICRGLLDGSIPVIDGCRRLTSLRHEVEAGQSAAFDTFIAVDSETDHLPLDEVRQHCSPEWLQKADAEIADTEHFYRESVRKAADALLRTLPPQAENN